MLHFGAVQVRAHHQEYTYMDTTMSGNETCTAEQFWCDSGLCLPSEWLCDGHVDCPSAQDEMGCPQPTCKQTMVKCEIGGCIPLEWLCDGEIDCLDLSDESNQTCAQANSPSCAVGFKKCLNSSECVFTDWWCDGDEDCDDSSDEAHCGLGSQHWCSAEQFECTNKTCIALASVCDGVDDCQDGADERFNCTLCTKKEFSCGDGHCITPHWLCDGERDCADGKDERECDGVVPLTRRSPRLNSTCDAQSYTCSDGGCTSISRVCDGVKDCVDNSDEGGRCGKRDCLKPTSNCSQTCYQSPFGSICQCRKGWDLGSDRMTCFDIDECDKDFSTCSQICTNSLGSFRCTCAPGYQLGVDNKTCKAKGPPAAIIFVVKNTVHMQTLTESMKKSDSMYLGHVGDAGGLALDFHRGMVYYADMQTKTIHGITLAENDYRDYKIISDISLVEGLTLDSAERKLYWTDALRSTIETVYVNGSKRRVLVSHDLDRPRAIAVDPNERLLFWTDWGFLPKIERMFTDGSERMVLIDTSIFWPNGIALDLPSQRVYWTEAKKNTIESCSYSGSRRTFFSLGKLSHPYGLALFEDRIFWTDWIARTVESADKYKGLAREVLFKGSHRPMRLIVAHPALQPKGVLIQRSLQDKKSHSAGKMTRRRFDFSSPQRVMVLKPTTSVTLGTHHKISRKIKVTSIPGHSLASKHVISEPQKSSKTRTTLFTKRTGSHLRNRTKKLSDRRKPMFSVFKNEKNFKNVRMNKTLITQENNVSLECPSNDAKCRSAQTPTNSARNSYENSNKLHWIPSFVTGTVFVASLLLLAVLKKRLQRSPSRRLGPTKRVYVKYFNMSEICNVKVAAYQCDCSPSPPGYCNPLYSTIISDLSSAHDTLEDPDVIGNDFSFNARENPLAKVS